MTRSTSLLRCALRGRHEQRKRTHRGEVLGNPLASSMLCLQKKSDAPLAEQHRIVAKTDHLMSLRRPRSQTHTVAGKQRKTDGSDSAAAARVMVTEMLRQHKALSAFPRSHACLLGRERTDPLHFTLVSLRSGERLLFLYLHSCQPLQILAACYRQILLECALRGWSSSRISVAFCFTERYKQQ